MVRDKENKIRPLFHGEIESIKDETLTVFVDFNRAKKGWHYGWVSNKHTCDSKHVFRVHILKRVNMNHSLVYTIDTPMFTLFCRRRQREHVPNLPTQIKNQLELTKRIKYENGVEISAASSLLQLSSPMSLSIPSLPYIKNRQSTAMKKKEVEKMLWSVIKALLQLDFNKEDTIIQESNIINCVSCGPSQKVLGKEGFCSICKKQIGNVDEIKTLGEFLDTFLPEITQNEPVSPLGMSLESDTDPFGDEFKFNFSGLEQFDFEPVREVVLDKDQILEDLGRFLIDENSLTSAIKKLFNSKKLKKASFKKRKGLVLAVFAEQIQLFLMRFGIGLGQLSLMIEENIISKQNKKRTVDLFEKYKNTKEAKAFVAPPVELPPSSLTDEEKLASFRKIESSLCGEWLNDNELSSIHELIRKDVGMPWLVRKMMTKMEKSYSTWFINLSIESVRTNSVQFAIGVKGKLLNSGKKIYTLDGKQYTRNFEWPIPVEKNVLQERTVPVCTAYVNYKDTKLVMFHNYGQLNRTVRILHGRPMDNGMAGSELAYQVKDFENSPWETKFYAKRLRIPFVKT